MKMKSSQSKDALRRSSITSTVTPKVIHIVRNVTVEPAMFFFIAGWNLCLVIGTTGVYWKVCEQMFGNTTLVNCSSLQYPPAIEAAVQRQTGLWSFYENIVACLPSLVLGPIYGAIGDRYGRKWNMILGLVGVLLYGVLYCLELSFVSMPMIFIPIGNFLLAFTGFSSNVLSSFYSYVADTTTDPDSLTMRFTALEATVRLADIVFGFATAVVVQHWGSTEGMLLVIGVWILPILYVLLCIQQIPPVSRKHASQLVFQPVSVSSSGKHAAQNQGSAKAALICEAPPATLGSKEIKTTAVVVLTVAKDIDDEYRKDSVLKTVFCLCRDSYKTVSKPRQGNRRAYVWVGTFIVFASTFSEGTMSAVLGLFALHSPINWVGYYIALFNGFNALTVMCGTVLGTFLMKKLNFHESTIILTGCLSALARVLVMCLATNGTMIYVAGALGVLAPVVQPTARSLASQFIETDEIGRILALYGMATDFGYIMSFSFSSFIYASTVHFYAGFVFVVESVLLMASLCAFLWVHFDYRKDRLQEIAREDEAESEMLNNSTKMTAEEENSVTQAKADYC